MWIAVLILFGVAAVALLSSLYALARSGVPVLRTPSALVPEIRAALELQAGELLIDLGCGDGWTLRALTDSPGVRGRGLELNGPVWLVAWLRGRLAPQRSRLQMRWADFQRAEIGQADCVFCYLMPGTMAVVGRKCQEELRPGARLACYQWPVPGWEPARVVALGRAGDPLFIYRMPPQVAEEPAAKNLTGSTPEVSVDR